MTEEAPTTDHSLNGSTSPSGLDLDEDRSIVEQARAKARICLDTRELSQNAAARAIGVGQSTFSQWLKDRYAGDNERVAHDVLDWLRRERDRADRPSIGDRDVVETSVYQRVHQVVRMAHHERDVGVVIGDAGLGKTLALEAYEEAHPSSTVRIEVGPEYSAKSVAIALNCELGGDGSGTLFDLMQENYDRLEGTDTVVIIDQAEILPTRGLELCRRVHDVCDLGVVLAGMPKLLAHLQGSSGDLKQLYSRVGLKARVEELSDEDLRMLVEVHAPSAAPGVAAVVGEVTRNTRIASKLLKRAAHIVEINEELGQVTEQAVERAMQMLVIPDPPGRGA